MKKLILVLLVFIVGCTKDDIPTPVVVTPVVVVPPVVVPPAATSTWSDDKTIEYEIIGCIFVLDFKKKLISN